MDGAPDPHPAGACDADSGERHPAAEEGGNPAADAVGPPPPAPGRAMVWAVLAGSLVLAGAFPAAELALWLCTPPRPTPGGWRVVPGAEAAWREALPAIWIAVVVAVWVFVFWSLIGSFLNVVVHRLPLGRSVVLGGSRCPRCGTAIKWHDNLPIVGWLRLGGRCRACGLPIAARYPLVESFCAGLGTAVYCRELLSGGTNLPVRIPDQLHDGLLRLVPSPGPDLLALTLYHAGTLCVLLVWGLIAWDRGRPPRWHVASVLLVAAGLAVVLPLLHPLPLVTHPAAAVDDGGRLVRGLATSVAGGGAGWLAGAALQAWLGRLLRGDAAGRAGLPLAAPTSLAGGLALVGVVLGWQGMLGTVFVLLAACLVQMVVWSARDGWPEAPPELLLVPATFLHLCFWRQLVEGLAPWWPGGGQPLACLLPTAALVAAVSLALWSLAPAPRRLPPAIDAGDDGRPDAAADRGTMPAEVHDARPTDPRAG